MGREARHKMQRRAQRRTAAFSVGSPGVLEVLSVGKGDLKIQIGDSNKDRANAQRIIEEMLRKGYTLFVETPDGPLKVRKFLPDEMAYLVVDTPDIQPEPEPEPGPVPESSTPDAAGNATPSRPAPAKRTTQRKVPVARSRTTAIGRTAGG